MRARSAMFAVLMLTVGCSDAAQTSRQTDVAARGAQVMPFDLDATTHTFTKTAVGGIQVVTADDPRDQEQIRLIREHLRQERDNFTRGDFDDPARIHGMDMPGVAELSTGYAKVRVDYADDPAGARLTYTSGDRALVDAIHAWFDRQMMDHGDYPTAG